ncbi:hypothetical protein [Variovorax sp. HJSM1_2]|uniref:hypothetical protein n=1 Tax=Variovorax sp. HJSM1_2 TaxID=3366263 RepID=UPI003BDFE58F
MKTAALVLASLAFLGSNAYAEKLVPDSPAEHYEGSMRFSIFKPCNGAGSLCSAQVLAEGLIELDSAAKLDRFLQTARTQSDASNTLPPFPKISFDSAGGSMTGALQLGRYLRAHKLNTNLESDYTRTSIDQLDRAETFVSNARCNTACVFAFAGGVSRSVDVESKMGLQQIPRIPVKNVVGGPITPSASELAIYLRDMGVRPELLNLAALAAPGSMVWFSESQLAQTRLDNSQPYASPWALIDSGTGSPVASVRQEISNAQNVSLMLGYHEGQFMVITSTELNRTLLDDARIQLFPVGGKPQISLRTEQQAIPVMPTRMWTRNDSNANAVFVAVGTISENEARLLSSARTLRLEDELPPHMTDLSGTVDLSTENLQQTLALLLRSK